MEEDPTAAVQGIDPNELDQVAEHLDDPSGRRRAGGQARRSAALRADDRLLDRRPRRRALGHRLPERRLLPATGGRARRRRPAPRLQHPDHVLVPQVRGRRLHVTRPAGVPPGFRQRIASTPTARRAERLTATSCSPAPRGCSATGSARPTPTTPAVAGASPSRPSRSAPPTTPRCGWRWPASARSLPRARRPTSRYGTPTRRSRCRRLRRVIAALTQPETWPDYASEIGRFTPLRPGGLAGQTFEIEVAAGTDSGRPIFTRGYVTITRLVTPDDPEALAAYFAELEEGLARYGDDEPQAVPEGGTPLVGFDLTTHQGHFMGTGHNRLLLYTHEGKAWVRAAGTWDPMPWHIDRAYRSRAATPSTRSGARAAIVRPEHAPPARAATGRVSADAVVIGSRAERSRRGHPARRGGPRGHRARGRRPARRRGPHRGADAARFPPRHVLLGVPGGRRLAGVRADAARPTTGSSGCTRGACYGPPAARRPRGRPLPRPRRDRGDRSTRLRAGDGERWPAFVVPS